MFSEIDIFPIMSKYPQFRFICGYPREVADIEHPVELKDGVLRIKKGTPLETLKESIMEICLHILLKHDEPPEGIKNDEVKLAVWHIAADIIAMEYIYAIRGLRSSIDRSIYEIFMDLMNKASTVSLSTAAGGQSKTVEHKKNMDRRTQAKSKTEKSSKTDKANEPQSDVEEKVRNELRRYQTIPQLTHKFKDLAQIRKDVGTTIIETSRMYLEQQMKAYGYGMTDFQSEIKFRDYESSLPFILVNVFHSEDYTFKKPNKRYLTYDLYLPALENNIVNLAILLDISLSMTQKELEKALGTLVTLLKFYDDYKVLFIEFSDGIVRKRILTPDTVSDLLQHRFRTGNRGGTDIRPVFKELEKLEPKPTVIVFTDMEFAWPERPSYADKIYWVVTKYVGSVQYGTVLHIT